jgi:hypothetical protein
VSPLNVINGIVPLNTSYAWNSPTGLDIDNGQSETDQPTINGILTNNANAQRTATYLVTPSYGTCTGSQFTVTVFLNPSPSINSMIRTICSGATFEITPVNGIDGFVTVGTKYKWNVPVYSNASLSGGNSRTTLSSSIFDGPILNPTDILQTVTYKIISVGEGNCGETSFTLVVSVSPKPSVNAMSTVTCSGSPFVVVPVNLTNGIIPADTRYAWDEPTGINIGNGQVATNQISINGSLTNGTAISRTATYLVTPSYGSCTGTQFTVTIQVNPAPSLNSIFRTICSLPL